MAIDKQTGGGDLFESETILRRTIASTPNRCVVEEDIGASREERKKCVGVFLSAVRLSDSQTSSFSVFQSEKGRSHGGKFRAEYG
jgi:hypothetical protein